MAPLTLRTLLIHPDAPLLLGTVCTYDSLSPDVDGLLWIPKDLHYPPPWLPCALSAHVDTVDLYLRVAALTIDIHVLHTNEKHPLIS